jgi:hypothetical protein
VSRADEEPPDPVEVRSRGLFDTWPNSAAAAAPSGELHGRDLHRSPADAKVVNLRSSTAICIRSGRTALGSAWTSARARAVGGGSVLGDVELRHDTRRTEGFNE